MYHTQLFIRKLAHEIQRIKYTEIKNINNKYKLEDYCELDQKNKIQDKIQ